MAEPKNKGKDLYNDYWRVEEADWTEADLAEVGDRIKNGYHPENMPDDDEEDDETDKA